MLRGLVLVGVGSAVGFLVGSVRGYRAAVTDYVENDARTIKSIADTMYDTAEPEDMPQGIQNLMQNGDGLAGGETTDGSGEDEDDDDDRAFA